MKFKLLMAATLLVLLGSSHLFATDVEFGPQVDWNKFSDANGGDWGVGARLEVGSSLKFIGAFDYYFVDVDILGNQNGPAGNNDFNLKFYEVSADLAYQFPAVTVKPYIGTGVTLSKRTFNNVDLGNFFDDNKSELGVNALGGLQFGNSPIRPFIEVRGSFYFGDETFNNRVVLSGGILF